jgi:hypothetical protein
MIGSHVGAWHFCLSQSATLRSPMSADFHNFVLLFPLASYQIDPFNLLFNLSTIIQISDCPRRKRALDPWRHDVFGFEVDGY